MPENFKSRSGAALLLPLIILAVSLLFSLLDIYEVRAEVREYDLTIAQEAVHITENPAVAMTINGSIPGPVLRFTEGDTARIHVMNAMDVDTSIHWHGILLPPEMDGVPYISFPPIAAGTTFTYEFPIRQSGTYWYHSHTGLQEQRGLYGAIVIDPAGSSSRHTDRDQVIVLSDWTDEAPGSVNRTLKRGSEWYALAKGSSQSILGAASAGMLGDYLQREFMRMPAMDIADVAYDRFLANGKVESHVKADPGKPVRLRIINGSSTTYFHLEFSGGPMTIIAADGIDVQHVQKQRFLIGVAETYDILVTLPSRGSFEFRATAHDGSGATSVWLGHGEKRFAAEVPQPNLYQTMNHFNLKHAFALTPAGTMGMPDNSVANGMFDKPGMMKMNHEMKGHGTQLRPGTGQAQHKDHMAAKMNMDSMEFHHTPDSQTEMARTAPDHMTKTMKADAEEIGFSGGTPPQKDESPNRSGKRHAYNFRFLGPDTSSADNLARDGMNSDRPWPPYSQLRSDKKTSFSSAKKVREIRLTLDGDMERYVWFLNNRALSESDSILIHEGEITRFIMINRTMMHHPMHLHGHFFRVLNGQGDYAPLKHTVNVAPMSTTVIEFDAKEPGDWFFHCHLLYHMKGGMARLVHYENYTVSPEVASVRPALYKDPWYFWGKADILSNMTEGMLRASNTRNILTASWEAGWQHVDHTKWEGIISWDRYINRFFTLFAGANLMGEKSWTEKTRGVVGFHYLLPLNVESRSWLDSDGGIRISLEKSIALTPRFSLFGEARYDTHEFWEGQVGLSYLFHKNFSVTALWHSDYTWGAGIQVRF